MSSFAQEESRSISENATWGQRKRFSDGKVCVPYSTFMGYDKDENGTLVINKKQAKVVEYIYSMYILGVGIHKLHKYLEKNNVPTCRGNKKWKHGVIKSILTNEKYKGDALLQKSFTVDYITKKKKKNEGELPQYYVENNHEAIIPRKIHDFVQRKMESEKNFHKNGLWRGKIICGICGGLCGSLRLHPEWKGGKKAWVCKKKYSKTDKCYAPFLYEDEILTTMTKALIKRAKDKRMVAKVMRLVTDSKERIKESKEEIASFQYGDMVAEKETIEILIKKIIFHGDKEVEMELIDGTEISM